MTSLLGRHGLGWISDILLRLGTLEMRSVWSVLLSFSCIHSGVRCEFFTCFRGTGLVPLNDGRCPHDVDVLRCLYIPPLSTLQARSLRMQIILYCYRRFDRYFCIYWEAESANRRSHCIWGFLGWWLVKLIKRRCFTQRWVGCMVEGCI